LDAATPPTLIESPYANEVSYTVPTTQFPGTIINTTGNTKGVTVTGPTSIPRGSTATYTITMTDGYRCINVIVNGTKYACLPDPVFVFNVPNVQSALTISVKISPAKPKNFRIVP
jgi:hypothetical protein